MKVYLALLATLLAAEASFSAANHTHAPRLHTGRQQADALARLSCTPFLIGAGADSLLECARRGQVELEKLRRESLARQTRDKCDAGAGGHCILFMGGRGRALARRSVVEGGVQLPGDPKQVREAREELLAMLALAAEARPADEWITRQRVRYLVEAGRKQEALTAVRPCKLPQRWWCPAIAGYVLHAMGLFRLAQDSFDVALVAMPPDVKRAWTDIAVFLEGTIRERYVNGYDESRDSLERRFWWLADPFYLTSANDRWTEQLARRVHCLLYEGTPSGFGSRWGKREDEVVLRHGRPLGWVNVWFPLRMTTGVTMRLHKGAVVLPPHSRRLVPHSRLLLDPTAIRPLDWSRETNRLGVSYAPTYLDTFGRLEHQVSVFHRGDSVVVVAAYDQTPDSGWRDIVGDVAVIFSQNEYSRPLMIRRRTSSPRGVLIARIEASPALMSFEFLSRGARRAARVRYGLRISKPVPLVLKLSSLLITVRSDSLPTNLHRASTVARGSLRVKAGERLGLYWEGYGLGPDAERLFVAVSLHRVGKGRYGGLEAVRLEDEPPINLSWDEVVPPRARIWRRSIALDLPDDLQPGLYVVYLVVKSYRREPVQQARALLVEP